MEVIQAEYMKITCPYDNSHKIGADRYHRHVMNCRIENPEKDVKSCPFNHSHIYPSSEHDFHLMDCPDRACVDREYFQNALDKNNIFKCPTTVPAFSEPLPILEDAWDEDLIEGFEKKPPPPDAIIEPPPMFKLAQRRQFYDQLPRTINGKSAFNDIDYPEFPSVPLSTNQSTRQPKTPSETQKLPSSCSKTVDHSTSNQTKPNQKLPSVSNGVNTQAIQKLGLGRGKPRSIATNIFGDIDRAVTEVKTSSCSNRVKDTNDCRLSPK